MHIDKKKKNAESDGEPLIGKSSQIYYHLFMFDFSTNKWVQLVVCFLLLCFSSVNRIITGEPPVMLIQINHRTNLFAEGKCFFFVSIFASTQAKQIVKMLKYKVKQILFSIGRVWHTQSQS